MTRLVIFAAIMLGPLVGASAVAGSVAQLCFGLSATIDDHSGEIVGTTGDDVIIGDDRKNVVHGEGGTDRICMGGGNDEMVPLCSHDEGHELYVDAGLGNDYVNSCIEGRNEIYGGRGDDALYANVGDDSVAGGPGNDDIIGGGGNDQSHGNAGNDDIDGGTGNDTIFGNKGRDRLYGEDGFDTLDGGSSKKKLKNKKRRADRDLCQVGPGGGTTVNCEREV